MKISYYLINLDSSVERLQQADAELCKHNIEYERISAVDGRQLDVKTYSNYDSLQANKLMGRDLLGGEIGCYLSHLKCIERFLASDSDYVVVLEDDLEITSNVNEILWASINWLEKNQPHWYLINICSHKRKISRKLSHFDKHDLLKAYYFPVLTLGLVWSRQGAQIFMNEFSEINVPIDVAIQSWLTNNSCGYSFYPPLMQPNGAESDISQTATKNMNTTVQMRRGKLLPRQKRMWNNKFEALKNLMLHK